MSDELEIISRTLEFYENSAVDGPGSGWGNYFEGVMHGLPVRILKVNDHVNGYVQLPDGHPWLDGEQYEDDWNIPASVHGGITFRDRKTRWVGFDTAHGRDHWPQFGVESEWKLKLYGEELHQWTPEELVAEVDTLAEQAAAAGRELTE
jgi:hypothetical protein